MEMEEIEAVLEKIWDIHDKLSDAIHTITRSHFIKSLRKSDLKKKPIPQNDAVINDQNNNKGGFVYVKECKGDDNNNDNVLMIEEAKSLNSIRSALENLEDHLEFLHTVQAQQQAERDAAIARLEQSRVILAMRLAEHHGKKYKVIEEALAFVGDVGDAGRFITPENLYVPTSLPGRNSGDHGKRSNFLLSFLFSSLNVVKSSLKLNQMGGLLGNAAVFAASMVALLQLHQAVDKKHLQNQDHSYSNRSRNRSLMESSVTDHLDVLLARG